MTAKPDEPHVGLVVEGAGDVNGVPVMLRDHLQRSGEYRDILGKPIPFHGKGNATVANGIEGYVRTAAQRPGCVGVLVVLDADDACVAEEGPLLVVRAQSATAKPVALAIADRNFEDWIYASAETLQLIADMQFDPAKRGATVIADALFPRKYAKPTWQPRLTARIDLPRARARNGSLDRMLLRFDSLVALIPAPANETL